MHLADIQYTTDAVGAEPDALDLLDELRTVVLFTTASVATRTMIDSTKNIATRSISSACETVRPFCLASRLISAADFASDRAAERAMRAYYEANAANPAGDVSERLRQIQVEVGRTVLEGLTAGAGDLKVTGNFSAAGFLYDTGWLKHLMDCLTLCGGGVPGFTQGTCMKPSLKR